MSYYHIMKNVFFCIYIRFTLGEIRLAGIKKKNIPPLVHHQLTCSLNNIDKLSLLLPYIVLQQYLLSYCVELPLYRPEKFRSPVKKSRSSSSSIQPGSCKCSGSFNQPTEHTLLRHSPSPPLLGPGRNVHTP